VAEVGAGWSWQEQAGTSSRWLRLVQAGDGWSMNTEADRPVGR